MIKSYDYIEYYKEDTSSEFYSQEEELARQIVELARKKSPPPKKTGCLCGARKTELFFTKWGVEYYRCGKCGSISADVSPEEIAYYHSEEALLELRKSTEYQNEVTNHRDNEWEEYIDWIRFRTYRHMQKRQVDIIDFGSRYTGFIKKLRSNPFCGGYELRGSILEYENSQKLQSSDITLHLNNLRQSAVPLADLSAANKSLKINGLIFISTRLGTGFDILTLKEHAKLYPYEHVFLPSISLLLELIEKTGFEVLDISTPGQFDAIYVSDNRDKINTGDCFIKFLMENADLQVLQELQRFLQKNGLSSFTQIVARKVRDV